MTSRPATATTVVTTGGGSDTVHTGDGNDVVETGDGDDEIVGGQGGGDDVYDAGANTDTVSTRRRRMASPSISTRFRAPGAQCSAPTA